MHSAPSSPAPAAARRDLVQHELQVLPVVDAAGQLLGIVTQTDLLASLGRPAVVRTPDR